MKAIEGAAMNDGRNLWLSFREEDLLFHAAIIKCRVGPKSQNKSHAIQQP